MKPTTREYPAILNETQAGEFLGFESQTLRNWRCAGRGPTFIKVSRTIRYRASDLIEFLDRHVVKTGDTGGAE